MGLDTMDGPIQSSAELRDAIDVTAVFRDVLENGTDFYSSIQAHMLLAGVEAIDEAIDELVRELESEAFAASGV